MTDQVSTVDPLADLLGSIGETPDLEPIKDEEEAPKAEATEEAATDTPPEELPKYLVKIKNDKGVDEEKEISVDELAKGYMLQADYTRKTQEVATQRQKSEAQYSQALQEQQSQAVEQINKLQELVLSQAAPELNGVDWVSLSVQDPARFVQLQAKQQQLHQTWQALETQKTQHQQAQEQHLAGLVDQVFKQSDEILSKAIPNLDGEKVGKLLNDVQKSIGWNANDLRAAAAALAKGGLHPGTLGQVLLLAHKAIQFDQLNTNKPAALKKVADAPKVIRPAAPQPPQTNREAVRRLQKSGSMEDLARLL